ncbi:uncharacterized protein TOT_030000860 [Theileria orientalis strain Shintoku]|uniref:U3 small nucleolar RNA-associated protein 6 N-terminal domain-containing protein n=1 Tax=Theileria orientalis strain Shintoku TaxID=869250 RepID=J4C455_THEOR|nr:uncharacterized protein TOT_030000860 [Theileria orientalis strain Shintoku]BAM41596.1 uncharacterized protein TOT_030000860 [Theileria orientalis strain Shintoku]|eukprot:XP_009691897.1 uncharacterized protein TOT_030000860 [Theileria orientalis strain Shintoku]
MADKVQKQLEDLVPDLQELLSQELFSLKEVKNIIERRRVFEFEIISPDPAVALDSYKKYIEYELELDKIIESRYRKMKKTNRLKGIDINGIIKEDISKGDSNYRGTSRKKLRVDVNNKRHIHRIFRRCLSRFISNTEMYNSYLSFCRQIKANRLFERVIMNGLSKNPNDENLWLILGSYVLKNRGIIASKNIIQRSLRIMPNNVNLILYLYQLEVKSLTEIAATYGEDKESIEESISKCHIIFEYGFENLKEEDAVKLYFSTLSIMNQLLNLKEHKDLLEELLEKINSKMKGRRIPIVRLYNHQINMLENMVSKSANRRLVGTSGSADDGTSASAKESEEEEDALLRMFGECYTDATTTRTAKDSSKGMLIPVLQFICNTIASKNTEDIEAKDNYTEIRIDVNPSTEVEERPVNELSDDMDGNGNELYIDGDKEYLIKNYCIIENVYYLCLLGRVPEYYDVKECKYTSNMANTEQLKKLEEVYANYMRRRREEVVKFALELSPEDVNEIYYHIKLLVQLAKLEDVEKSVGRKLQKKIKEMLEKLTTIRGLIRVSDELAQMILKLKVDFELKRRAYANFKSLALNHFKFFINSMFSSQLSVDEKIEVFLICYKHNEEYENLKIFLNKLENMEEFVKFTEGNSEHLDEKIYNELVAYMTDEMEAKVERMSTSEIEVSELIKEVSRLNGWIGNRNMEVSRENKQKISNLNRPKMQMNTAGYEFRRKCVESEPLSVKRDDLM